jgi:hypothetical protein
VEDFVNMFDEMDEVRRFNEAICKECSWQEAKSRGVDCGGARRAMRRVMVRFHPDKVQSRFSACTMDLKPWATSAVMELTQDVNKFCGARRNARDEL